MATPPDPISATPISATPISATGTPLTLTPPDPVPVVIMGRLATNMQFQNQGLGSALVLDAIDRTAALALQIGIRALLVHAKNEGAAGFYRKHGFKPSPQNELLLLARV